MLPVCNNIYSWTLSHVFHYNGHTSADNCQRRLWTWILSPVVCGFFLRRQMRIIYDTCLRTSVDEALNNLSIRFISLKLSVFYVKRLDNQTRNESYVVPSFQKLMLGQIKLFRVKHIFKSKQGIDGSLPSSTN